MPFGLHCCFSILPAIQHCPTGLSSAAGGLPAAAFSGHSYLTTLPSNCAASPARFRAAFGGPLLARVASRSCAITSGACASGGTLWRARPANLIPLVRGGTNVERSPTMAISSRRAMPIPECWRSLPLSPGLIPRPLPAMLAIGVGCPPLPSRQTSGRHVQSATSHSCFQESLELPSPQSARIVLSPCRLQYAEAIRGTSV